MFRLTNQYTNCFVVHYSSTCRAPNLFCTRPGGCVTTTRIAQQPSASFQEATGNVIPAGSEISSIKTSAERITTVYTLYTYIIWNDGANLHKRSGKAILFKNILIVFTWSVGSFLGLNRFVVFLKIVFR